MLPQKSADPHLADDATMRHLMGDLHLYVCIYWSGELLENWDDGDLVMWMPQLSLTGRTRAMRKPLIARLPAIEVDLTYR